MGGGNGKEEQEKIEEKKIVNEEQEEEEEEAGGEEGQRWWKGELIGGWEGERRRRGWRGGGRREGISGDFPHWHFTKFNNFTTIWHLWHDIGYIYPIFYKSWLNSCWFHNQNLNFFFCVILSLSTCFLLQSHTYFILWDLGEI